MPRKRQLLENGFVLFNVTYEDGTLSSNRKVPSAEIDQLDAEASARAAIERRIARSRGCPAARVDRSRRSSAPMRTNIVRRRLARDQAASAWRKLTSRCRSSSQRASRVALTLLHSVSRFACRSSGFSSKQLRSR